MYMNNRILSNLSVTKKLQRLQALTVGLALVLTLLISSITQVWQVRRDNLRVAVSIGEVIGFNAAAALLFNDAESGKDILASLRGRSDILAAQLYDAQGAAFADYALADYKDAAFPPTLKQAEDELLKRDFQFMNQVLLHPVIQHNDRIGTLRLVIDLKTMWENVLRGLIQISLVIMLAYLISAFYGRRLSRQIAAPLIRLSKLATQVSSEKNYSVRAIEEGKDEIGQLVQSFNQMIEQVQARDKDLEGQRGWLEREVELRTADLRKAMEEAQAASIAKSQFLATMSHEIRTPMNGVLGMTELLMNTGLNERQSRLAEKSYRSAKSLLGIINNILDFSKIEAGKLQLIPIDFDARRLLEETVELFAEQAYRKNVELILNIPCDFNLIAHGDSERLRQVLVNLVGNAVKFTEKGEVQLRLSQLDSAPDTGSINLLFEIIDTGPGIAIAMQRQIFESFTQQDGTITRRYGGTGLGLTISRQLVELMGGQLKLESTQGQGSRFYFSLNLPLSSLTTVPKADIIVLKGIHVLVVDDNVTNRQILEGQLTQWGAKVSCVDTGPKALKLLHDARHRDIHFRLALLDWHMPNMDGLSLAKAIQADPLISKLPLIMLSSESVSFDQEEGSDLFGISYFLDKPVFQNKLLDCLLELLAKKPVPKTESEAVATKSPLIFNALILLAEDNLVNQEVTKGFLESIGCTTVITNNGLEAVEAAINKDYDLILMDCHMPELDGFAATQKIREYEASKDKKRTPIIALTADVQKGIETQCQNAGMDSYLSKPFDLEQLQSMLEEWLADVKERQGEIKATSAIEQKIFTADVLDRDTVAGLKSVSDAKGLSLFEKASDIYLKTAPICAEKIRSSVNRRNGDEIGKLAHSLKSSSANLGAITLAAQCQALETAGRNGDLSEIDRLYGDFETHFIQVRHALQQEREHIERNTRMAAPSPSEQLSQKMEIGVTILLVDDDETFRLITSETLRDLGYRVLEAKSGNATLQKVKIAQPDLIILDALMDDMDGFETCKALRSMPAMADVPIIMSTGLDDIESINKAYSVGASDFIIKPVNYTVLQYHIQFLLRTSRDTSELRGIKQQLSAAQKIARLGYWIWYVEQNKFVVSPYLAELCGIDLSLFKETLDGFLALIIPEDRLKVEDIIYSALEGEATDYIEYSLQTSGRECIIVCQETALMSGYPGKMLTGTVQDVSRQKETERMIHQLAYYDELTGLASRAFYQERIDQIIKCARRSHEQFAFLYLDIDEFKYVNDSFGHNVGDQFLKAIAQRIQSVIRDVDFAARLGGDEFCIIVDNTTNDSPATEVAERCLSEINLPLLLSSHHLKPRVSIGIAMYPQDGENEHDLMKAADAAMYSAKNSGKQRYSYYRPEMTALALKRLHDEQLLREAVEKQQFVLFYQPQVDSTTGVVTGIEALLRWQHPHYGLIAPLEFIALAENLGLIKKIGNWVIETACDQVVQWHQQGMPLFQIAVNLSPLHFRDPQLVETVRDILKKAQIAPHYLVLEVTESVMQTQGDLEIFTHLKKLGVKIAIDDFGTGYSSLASLKKLPIDCLKIDKTFVQDLLYDSQTSVLLSAIINISEAMGYDLVAEGVETFEQLIILRDKGCPTIQGYFFSKAVPANELRMLIDRGFKLSEEMELVPYLNHT
jgi:diguanylate cyclase (GGDEF)-like protein